MNFSEAIRVCFTKYADFNGVAGRSEFWWFALFNLICTVVLGFFSAILSGLFSVATLVPYLAVASRRLHDTDRSGWLQLVGLIPLIGWIIVIYWLAQEGKSSTRFAS